MDVGHEIARGIAYFSLSELVSFFVELIRPSYFSLWLDVVFFSFFLFSCFPSVLASAYAHGLFFLIFLCSVEHGVLYACSAAQLVVSLRNAHRSKTIRGMSFTRPLSPLRPPCGSRRRAAHRLRHSVSLFLSLCSRLCCFRLSLRSFFLFCPLAGFIVTWFAAASRCREF